MSKLIDNAKRLKDNIHLSSVVAPSGTLYVTRKVSPEVVEVWDKDSEEVLTLYLADLPKVIDLLIETVEYIENLP